MVWQGEEKRRFPRADIPCKITIYFPEERIITTRTKNIGYGGVRVILDYNLNVSSVIGMEIFVNGGKIVKCKGKVVWKLENKVNVGKKTYDLGIEFLDIKESDKEEIKKVVDSALKS